MTRFDLKVGVIIGGRLGAATHSLYIFGWGGNNTRTDTTLFGVLQFIFSVAFAWSLARSSSEREFQQRQKNFAISAYRRIREISRAAERMLRRAGRDAGDVSEDLMHELEVMREISTGICDTAKSSVADWADLIGDEISTLERIESLRRQESDEPDTSGARHETGIGQGDADAKHRVEDTTSSNVEKLIEGLPPALRMEASKTGRHDSRYLDKIQRFKDFMQKNGYVELDGFWEPDNFDDSIEKLSERDDAQVSVGDARQRTTVLLLLDENGNSVGIITNDFDRWGLGAYPDFLRAVTRSVGSSCFPVKVTHIEPQRKDTGRIYFTVRILPTAIDSAKKDVRAHHPGR